MASAGKMVENMIDELGSSLEDQPWSPSYNVKKSV